MKTEAKVYTEKVDDVPLLLHLESEMGIGTIINEVVLRHGNREGISVGAQIMVWLSYIISQSDHRMCEVETWAQSQIKMLQTLIPEPISSKDFADDKLADSLKLLNRDEIWAEIETKLAQRIIRVYQLEKAPIRLDSTTCAVYHDSEGKQLIEFGYSKDHRPDLAQFKVMLGSLDPLGLPLATAVVSGAEADDGLYLPTIKTIQRVVGQAGQLYIGDSKMATLATRASIAQGQDYYLLPLPKNQPNTALLADMVHQIKTKQKKASTIYGSETKTETETTSEPETQRKIKKILALGSEKEILAQAEIKGETFTWSQRVLAVYSPTLAQKFRRNLHDRLAKAEQELVALTPAPKRGCRQYQELCPLQADATQIIERYKVKDLLTINYQAQTYTTSSKGQPSRLRYQITVSRNSPAIAQERGLLGWRLYATNAPSTSLSLDQAVLLYRNSPLIDHSFSRLKGRPLGLRPLFIQREDHINGLVRLLSLALRILTLAEFLVRQSLQLSEASLAGLYAGNPQRKTAFPSAERLFKAFRGIFLSIISLPDQTIYYLSPLSPLQSHIIALLRLPTSIYNILISEIPFAFP
jgi:transposase